jgi:hypothetical protein
VGTAVALAIAIRAGKFAQPVFRAQALGARQGCYSVSLTEKRWLDGNLLNLSWYNTAASSSQPVAFFREARGIPDGVLDALQ